MNVVPRRRARQALGRDASLRVGIPAVRTAGAHREQVTIARSGQLWRVCGFGEEIHVRDSRGMQMRAQLVAEPGRELHAIELSGGREIGVGDAGEVLDRTAKQSYRARLTELVAERDRAEAWADAGRLERVNAEIEALGAELSRAIGLGGRDRRVGAASERARSNVQRRILHAIQQIRAGSRRLGEHFTASVRTGTYCRYDP